MLQIKFKQKAFLLKNGKRIDGTQIWSGNETTEDTFDKSLDYRRFDCKKWGVVTTIFEPPSEAVRRFLYRKEWCLVIVGDKGKPKHVKYK